MSYVQRAWADTTLVVDLANPLWVKLVVCFDTASSIVGADVVERPRGGLGKTYLYDII